jgi:GIY-YIG catalytic domain
MKTLTEFLAAATKAEFAPKALPTVPAVYAFIFLGECGYIGQTKNLKARMTTHKSGIQNPRLTNWIRGSRVTVHYLIVEDESARLALEAALIANAHPYCQQPSDEPEEPRTVTIREIATFTGIGSRILQYRAQRLGYKPDSRFGILLLTEEQVEKVIKYPKRGHWDRKEKRALRDAAKQFTATNQS